MQVVVYRIMMLVAPHLLYCAAGDQRFALKYLDDLGWFRMSGRLLIAVDPANFNVTDTAPSPSSPTPTLDLRYSVKLKKRPTFTGRAFVGCPEKIRD